MRTRLGHMLLLAGAALLSGCQATVPPAGKTVADLQGRWHTIEMTPSAKLPEIRTYNKFNPVWWWQNSDDPVPPAWYKPDDLRRNTKWRFRNPMHNFTFYVIGVADKKFLRSGRYPSRNGNPNGGWAFMVSRRKLVPLPFISYKRGGFEFYLGWRNRGNFGAKINMKSQADAIKAWQNEPVQAAPAPNLQPDGKVNYP